MKRILGLFSLIIVILCVVPASFVSCTDIDGDGIDSIYYPGSTLPQNTSYRNPVWEPDFELGTIFRGTTNFVAIASETQWANGIIYNGPILVSNNLMRWSFNSIVALPATPDTVVSGNETTIFKRPDWAEGRLHSMTAGFARTIASTPNWLFYQLGDNQAIGAACARSPQGPYIDLGKLIDNTNTSSETLSHPFFIVVGARFYLFYSTNNGSYVQELTLRRNQLPVLRNEPVRVSGHQFKDVAVYRKGNWFYIFGTVANGETSEIRYARASDLVGPYSDAEGNDLISSNGSLLIESGSRMVNPFNVCGIFADANDNDFILYNITDIEKPLLDSGLNRRPLMMNYLNMNENGWIEGVITPEMGWTSPKFSN
jgi:hypothetical protein